MKKLQKTKPTSNKNSVEANQLEPQLTPIPHNQDVDERKTVKIDVHEVDALDEEEVIGGSSTHLAVKDPKSYMIGTYWKGVIQVENGLKIYSGSLHKDDTTLHGMIYIPSMKCYLLASECKLYRKDINTNAPYLFLAFNFDLGCFWYSVQHQRLALKNGAKGVISVLNLQTKKREISLKKRGWGSIVDFRFFGRDESKIVSLFRDGCFVLYSLIDPSQKRGVLAEYQLTLIEERHECPVSLAVCERDDYFYFLVEIGQNLQLYAYSSRLILLKMQGDSLVQFTWIDQYSEGISENFALDCLGCFGKNIWWVGLSCYRDGMAQLFRFDTVTGQFEELRDKREFHQENKPVKLHRCGDKLYYTGNKALVMSLSLVFY